MGLFRLTADKVAYIFGVRVSKRLRGKLHSVLEKLDHGHHLLRIYCKKPRWVACTKSSALSCRWRSVSTAGRTSDSIRD